MQLQYSLLLHRLTWSIGLLNVVCAVNRWIWNLVECRYSVDRMRRQAEIQITELHGQNLLQERIRPFNDFDGKGALRNRQHFRPDVSAEDFVYDWIFSVNVCVSTLMKA
jgi:hypothetical protein